MGDPEAHIAAWESAGLIDADTAARLRAAGALPEMAAERVEPAPEMAQAVAMFGPSVTIPEVFGYLGTAFLLAGWTAFVTRIAAGDDETMLGVGGVVAAAVLIGLGFVLRRGDARRQRAAGVAFLVSIAYGAGGVISLLAAADVEGPPAGVIAAAAAVALALWLRLTHPSVLTQIGLLSGATALAAAILTWIESVVIPQRDLESPLTAAEGPDPLILLVVSAAWWLATAVVIGLIGLREARSGPAPGSRRAAISRFWAGVVAVAGLSSAVTRSVLRPGGESERVLEPWIGELAIVVLSVVLLERAFRRDATSFVYAAALGLIVALSDFNFTYLSETTEIGLVIEGAILLLVGIGADRLRRRIGRMSPAR